MLAVKRSRKAEKKYKERQKDGKVEQALQDQFMTGKSYFLFSVFLGVGDHFLVS